MPYSKPLIKSLSQLKKAYSYAVSKEAADKPDYAEQFRNSAIQCFEFTYESCWKALRRKLMEDAPNPNLISTMGFKELIRLAGEKELLDNVENWFNYREKRNITSHTYNEQQALEVFKIIPEFIADVEFILKRM